MKAPDFSLPDQYGVSHSLADYQGKWLVLYFYPKDDTPGCTTQACNFRDSHSQYQRRGVAVVGISKDNLKSHQKFTAKYSLNFPLLSDETGEVIRAYGAWGKKKFMGREFEGILRKTFVIDPSGDVVKVYDVYRTAPHNQIVLGDLDSLLPAA